MFCCLLKLLSVHLLGHFPKCSDVFDTWNFPSRHLLWRASMTIQPILLMFLLLETFSLPMIFTSFPFELSTPLAPLWILPSTDLLHPWGLKTLHPNNGVWSPHTPFFIMSAIRSHGVLQFLPLQVNQSSFDITFFPGHHRPQCVSIWCVYVFVHEYMLHLFCFGLCIFTDIEFIYTTSYAVKCTSLRCTVWRIFTYVSPM